MASPPSQKRQKVSASMTSPTTVAAPIAPVEAPGPSQPAATSTTFSTLPPPPANPRKRRASNNAGSSPSGSPSRPSAPAEGTSAASTLPTPSTSAPVNATPEEAGRKKGRTNTPWTATEEQRLKTMRDAGNSWGEIAKVPSPWSPSRMKKAGFDTSKAFPSRTEGSVKKHWYKDMHYAEFAEDESIALREAIREYEANKWKVIGQKVGKPAKACEQYAKEHFRNI